MSHHGFAPDLAGEGPAGAPPDGDTTSDGGPEVTGGQSATANFGEVFGPFDVPDAASAHDFAATGRGQEFTFRVLASSGGNTGVVEVAVYAQPR